MAAVVNARDVLLQGASARLVAVTLGTLQTFSGTVSGNVTGTVNSVAAATLTAQASAAYALQQALTVSGTTTLKGVIVPSDSGAMKFGDITWNTGTGAITGGSGMAITPFGLLGAKAGVAKLVITNTGDITYSGVLNGATGTFSGSISTVEQIYAAGTHSGAYATIEGRNSYAIGVAIAGVADGSGANIGVKGLTSSTDGSSIGVKGQAGVGFGVYGIASGSGGIGTYGINQSSGGFGLYGRSDYGTAVKAYSTGGTALAVDGVMTMTSTTKVANLNADLLDGYHAGNASGKVPVSNGSLNVDLIAAKLGDTSDGAHTYNFSGGTNTGSATATFSGTNKPGGNSTNTWVKLTIDSTTLYIPAWT